MLCRSNRNRCEIESIYDSDDTKDAIILLEDSLTYDSAQTEQTFWSS